MKSSQFEIRERMNSMKKRIQKIEVDAQNVSQELVRRLQQETNVLFPKLYDYMHSQQFEKKLCISTTCSPPPAMDTWEKTKTKVMKEIESRFKQLLVEWESENQLCSAVHRKLVDEFFRRFGFLHLLVCMYVKLYFLMQPSSPQFDFCDGRHSYIMYTMFTKNEPRKKKTTLIKQK